VSIHGCASAGLSRVANDVRAMCFTRPRDGVQDRVEGGAGRDRARLDRVLDRQLGIETLF
jgi:hypothetical protein